MTQLLGLNQTECLQFCAAGKVLPTCASVIYMMHNETCFLSPVTRINGLELEFSRGLYTSYWEMIREGM